MISYFEQDPTGSVSRSVEVINNKIQINFGTNIENDVTYQVYFKKADRSGGNLVPASDGNDPDTIKVVVVATWTDIFNNNQQLTENYFLTNWSSTSWTEYNNATFSDGSPAPVLTNSVVNNDSVLITSAASIANTDWCVITENVTAKSYDLFPVGSGSTQAIATNTQSGGVIDYEMYEPALTGPIPTNAPAPLAPIMPTLNNNYPEICDGTGISITQCESLIRLHDSTNGGSWTDNTNWKSTSTPCNSVPTGGWVGVTCSAGNVTSINLPNNALTGTLPAELGNFTLLETLNLSGNQITGSIPPQIGRLTSLTTLNLSSNQLDGVIPQTIANNTSLSILNLSVNALDGQIPASMGRLSALDELYLQNNTLTCHVPTTIANLSDIDSTKLNLSYNNLMLPSTVTLLNTYLTTTKSAILTNQSSVIQHEDCVYKPSSDNVYITQYNTTEGEAATSLYLEKFTNGTFPPTMTETIINTVGWENNTNSGGLGFVGTPDNDVAVVPYSAKWNIEDEMTIMTWIKSNNNAQGSFDRIMDFSDGSTTGWYLSFMNPNKIHFKSFGTNNLEVQAANPTTGYDWHHVAVVIANGTGTLYINGVSEMSDTYSNLVPVPGSTHTLKFGNSAALTHAADIDLDEVRIYERALSLNEIIKSSATEINRNDPGLIGYWRMNITNSADQTFYDYSYQGQHGTRGLDFNPNAHDPSLVTGNVKYRVNDIYKYNNKIYMSTTNPVKDVVVYNLDTSTHNILDLGIGSNDDTQGVVIASDTRGYAIQDNSVVQFDPSDLTIDDSKNLSTNGGLKNIVDIKLNSNKLYLLGLVSDGNFGVMDVTNGITPTPRVNNLLLEAFL